MLKYQEKCYSAQNLVANDSHCPYLLFEKLTSISATTKKKDTVYYTPIPLTTNRYLDNTQRCEHQIPFVHQSLSFQDSLVVPRDRFLFPVPAVVVSS